MPRARESGMEVSEAQLKQMEGRQDMVKSRVAVHAFDVAAVNKTDIRRHGNRARNVPSGQTALKERDSRRIGLAISLITILVTMLGVWLAIRNLETAEPLVPSTGRKKAR